MFHLSTLFFQFLSTGGWGGSSFKRSLALTCKSMIKKFFYPFPSTLTANKLLQILPTGWGPLSELSDGTGLPHTWKWDFGV